MREKLKNFLVFSHKFWLFLSLLSQKNFHLRRDFLFLIVNFFVPNKSCPLPTPSLNSCIRPWILQFLLSVYSTGWRKKNNPISSTRRTFISSVLFNFWRTTLHSRKPSGFHSNMKPWMCIRFFVWSCVCNNDN